MATHNLNFYSHWTRQRIGEMDAAIASVQRYAKRFPAGRESTRLITRLKKRRDRFEDAARKFATMREAAWQRSKTKLDSEWEMFEAQVSAFIEKAQKRSGFQKSAFGSMATAQSRAWREVERSLRALTRKVFPARRNNFLAAIMRIKNKGIAMKTRTKKLRKSAKTSWSVMQSALATSRRAFDRANQQASRAMRKAFR